MTQDEIIEMARQAGFTVGHGSPALPKHETFAKLVAEKAFKDGYAIGEAAGFKEGVKLERKAWCEA